MGFIDISEFQPIEPVPGCRMRTPFGEHLMLSYLEMDDGTEVPMHSHTHEQGGMLISGTLQLSLRTYSLRAGDTFQLTFPELGWNNKVFEVQRSANGTDFAALGWVAGAGISLSAHSYQYLDAAPLPALAYYRLRQIDFDGSSAYGPTVAVAAGPAASVPHVYPNPATGGQATLAWQATATHHGRWTLTNGLGQVVQTELVAGEAGPNTCPLHLAAARPGTYWLTLEIAGQLPSHVRVQVTD